VVLADNERLVLQGWARRRTSQALALRSRIVLACADNDNNGQVADELGISRNTVSKWRNRFVAARLEGLSDEPRPGAPRTITDEQVEQVIVKTLEQAPSRQDTHWSTRSMAAATGMSQTAISRIWRAFGLKPHLVDTWKLSTDPQFIDKVRDVVASTSIRRRTRWSSRSTRKARCRRWTGPPRSCRSCPVPRRG
jgi:transposase